jgi:predicted PurR-regulated permease PerM
MKNNNLKTFFFIILVIGIFFLIYKKFYDKTSPFNSNIYNKYYNVREQGSPEVRQTKANLLGNVYNRLETLVNTLKSGQNIPQEYQTAVNRLISKIFLICCYIKT